MSLEIPSSMSECLFFTRRVVEEEKEGKIMAWARRKDCPKCHKAKMGKPLDPKTKKPKIRSTEYVCPECGFTEDKKSHEESLTLEVIYTCPHCQHSGESSTIFKRKTYKGVPSFLIECASCKEKIPITKKMKEK